MTGETISSGTLTTLIALILATAQRTRAVVTAGAMPTSHSRQKAAVVKVLKIKVTLCGYWQLLLLLLLLHWPIKAWSLSCLSEPGEFFLGRLLT